MLCIAHLKFKKLKLVIIKYVKIIKLDTQSIEKKFENSLHDCFRYDSII